MTKMVQISLARDFSRHPGPRYSRQGDHSGEAFRKRLVKELSSASDTVIVVDLDGTSGIGSSFIDEAFGKLISVEGWKLPDLRRRLKVTSSQDETYLSDLEESLVRAAKRPAKQLD